MSKPGFESIEDQFSPHLNEWYEIGLQDWYPELMADSALGKIAVELEQTINESEIGLRGCDRSNRIDCVIYVEQINENAVALARRDVFQVIYDDLAGQPTEKDYQTAVLEARQRGTWEADRIWVPSYSKSALALFPQEVCFFLSLEENQHFKKLARAR